MIATCYDETSIYGPNSWSIAWGNAGWYQMQENYMPFVTQGVVFAKIPASVKQALAQPLTEQQVTLAETILDDIRQVLGILKDEIGGFAAKLGKIGG